MSFAEKLTELRRRSGMSQEQLGEKLGVTRQTVSKWELGATTPEMEKLAALSELFEISTDELIKGAAPQPQSAAASPQPLPAMKKADRLHYEYKSRKAIRGVPLVHVNFGLGMYTAKGIIAVGNCAVGVLAVGFAALGAVSVGLVALGLVAMAMFLAVGVAAAGLAAVGAFAAGAFACGLFAAGAIAMGWLSFGGIAMGEYAFGGLANATRIAVGGSANGYIAIGDAVNGTVELTPPVDPETMRTIILTHFPDTPRFIADLVVDMVQSLKVQ